MKETSPYVVAGKKAWKTNPRIGMEAMLSADFGESFVAYLLVKEGVDVVRASSIGFDLFAIDSTGEIFPKNKTVCVSVKTRISKRHKSFAPTIPIDEKKLAMAKETWHADAWVGIVVGSTSSSKVLDAFVFPLEDLPKLRGKAKRKNVVAVSQLRRNPTGRVIRLF